MAKVVSLGWTHLSLEPVNLGSAFLALVAESKSSTAPEADLKMVLAAFPTKALNRLLDAKRNGRLIRRSFSSGRGRGCIMNRLDLSIRSFDDIDSHEAMDAETRAAASRVIMAWDAKQLTTRAVERIVVAALKDRATANAAEEAAIKRVTAKLRKRTVRKRSPVASSKAALLNHA